jgi:hypothetical protein
MVSETKKSIASECPRNDRKTLGDGFGIPVFTVFQDFETFFNKFLEPDRASNLISLCGSTGRQDPKSTVKAAQSSIARRD